MGTQIDSKAFEILVRQHHRRLLAYATAMTGDEASAKDIVQNAFITAYRSLSKFDVGRDFGAWLRGIVRNKFREWLRQKSKQMVPLTETAMATVDAEYQRLDELAENNERLFGILRSCIGRLPDLMQRAVDLFYMRRMSGREVAQELGTTPDVTRKRLQRARTHLADCVTATLEASNV